MSRYLIANIEVKQAEFGRFVETMGVMREILTRAGWALVNSHMMRTGVAGTVLNVWRLDSLEQIDAGFGALALDPRWPTIQATLAEVVLRETVNFADDLAYPAPA